LNPLHNPVEDNFEVLSNQYQKFFSKMKFSANSSPVSDENDKMMIEIKVIDNIESH